MFCPRFPQSFSHIFHISQSHGIYISRKYSSHVFTGGITGFALNVSLGTTKFFIKIAPNFPQISSPPYFKLSAVLFRCAVLFGTHLPSLAQIFSHRPHIFHIWCETASSELSTHFSTLSQDVPHVAPNFIYTLPPTRLHNTFAHFSEFSHRFPPNSLRHLKHHPLFFLTRILPNFCRHFS